TGRLRDHWHSLTRTAMAPVLTRHVEEPWLSLHPLDLQRLKLEPHALVRVRSRRGAIVLPVRPDDTVRPGHAFLPMHWGSAYMGGHGINALTNPARDPVSRQPELKHAAVAVEPARLPWQAMAWVAGDTAVLRAQLAPWLRGFEYAALLPCAAGPGVAAPGAFRLAGEVRAHDGLMAWAEGGAAPASLATLLMARAPAAPRTRTVCACVGVSEAAIRSGIESGMDVAQLKDRLGCGSGCGSCLPEVRRMVALHGA